MEKPQQKNSFVGFNAANKKLSMPLNNLVSLCFGSETFIYILLFSNVHTIKDRWEDGVVLMQSQTFQRVNFKDCCQQSEIFGWSFIKGSLSWMFVESMRGRGNLDLMSSFQASVNMCLWVLSKWVMLNSHLMILPPVFYTHHLVYPFFMEAQQKRLKENK